MDPELKAYLDAMHENLVTRMVDLNNATREHAEHLHVQARVLIEQVDNKVDLVWEGVQAIKKPSTASWRTTSSVSRALNERHCRDASPPVRYDPRPPCQRARVAGR